MTLTTPLIAALILISALGWAAEDRATPIASLRAMPRSEAAKRPSVRLRGIVTVIGEGLAPSGKFAPVLSSFCVQDDSGGIWVSTSQALRDGVWKQRDQSLLFGLKAGMEIELEGVMDAGAFAPVVLPSAFRVLGKKSLPEAKEVSLTRLMRGAEDIQRIQVSGVVQSMTNEGGNNNRWILKVETGLGHFLSRLPMTEEFTPARLLDAEVQLTGVAAASRNWRAEFTCPRLVIGRRQDVVIVKAAPSDPFAVREVKLAELDSFSPEGRPLHRLRIQGTVTYQAADEFVYLQDGNGAVRIEPSGEVQWQAGDRVEATGFIDTSRAVAGMSGALLRKLSTGTPPEPQAITMEDIDADFQRMRKGRPMMNPGYDGLLVSLRGTLLSVQEDKIAGAHRLVLDCGESLTLAHVRAAVSDLLPGSELKLTGIAQLQYAPTEQAAVFAKPTRLDLLLRDRGDIAVLSKPSWWTLQRTYAALLSVVLVALAALAWGAALRRTVAKQTRQLAQEMRARRDAAVEFQATLRERTRLAANLHDTVLQTMTGLAYQIEACESESLPIADRAANHLDTARRMAQRGQEDLRNAVWALRALPMKEGSFSDAVSRVAQQISAGHDVQVKVETEGDLPHLADFIAGNVLLVIQEAIHNTLKHAKAKHILVTLAATDQGRHLAFSVKDDGAGFVVGAQPGHALGHFGLEGMRERVERLGGILIIESQPSTGTIIRTEVPLRDFDHDIS